MIWSSYSDIAQNPQPLVYPYSQYRVIWEWTLLLKGSILWIYSGFNGSSDWMIPYNCGWGINSFICSLWLKRMGFVHLKSFRIFQPINGSYIWCCGFLGVNQPGDPIYGDHHYCRTISLSFWILNLAIFVEGDAESRVCDFIERIH